MAARISKLSCHEWTNNKHFRLNIYFKASLLKFISVYFEDGRFLTFIKIHIFCFQPEFYQVCHTKKDYEEIGPSICRHNPVFGVMS